MKAMTAVSGKAYFLSDRFILVSLCLILALAALLRAWALFGLSESIYFELPLIDERVYHNWAARIAGGEYTQTTVYRFSPFPVYVIAFIYKLFSPDIYYTRILNLLLGTATCWLIYLITDKMAGKPAGLAACLMAALYEPFILYSIVPLKTGLAIFLFALTIFYFLNFVGQGRAPDYRPALYSGLALGALAATREHALVLIPVIFLLLFIEAFSSDNALKAAFKRLLPFAAGLLIVLSPFIINNYKASRTFAVTSSQTGLNLYLAYNPDNPTPYYMPVSFASSSPFEQESHFTIEAERRTGRDLTSKEASRFWRDETLRMFVAHPAESIKKFGQKVLASFNRYEPGDHYSTLFLEEIIPFFKLPLLSIGLIFPLAMASIITLFRRSRNVLYIAVIFMVYMFTLALLFTTARYRVPLLTFLIPLAALGGKTFIDALNEREWNKVGAFTAVAFLFTLIQWAPVKGAGDMTSYLNSHASFLYRKGRTEEAMKYWERSSLARGRYSDFANSSLAARYYEREDFKKAIQYLDNIGEDSFEGSSKQAILGAIHSLNGQTEEAVKAFEKALEINSANMNARKLLVEVLRPIDLKRSEDEAEELEKLQNRTIPL